MTRIDHRILTMGKLKQSTKRFIYRIAPYSVIRVPTLILARLGLLPTYVWYRVPVTRAFRSQFAPDSSFVYTSTSGDVIGRCLYWRGVDSWEPETTSIFRNLARHSRTFVDIGANTGF